MCQFKEIDIWLKDIICWQKGVLKSIYNGLKMDPECSQNAPKVVPNGPKWFPPPSPSPASAKVSCQGARKIGKNISLMIFYDSYDKVKKVPCQGA